MNGPSRFGRLAWIGLFAVLGLVPLGMESRFALSLLSQMGIACMLCLSYWLLMGQGGMLSFGHAVYSGCGAFTAMHLLRLVEASGWTAIPVGLLPLAGGLAAALLALPTGWLATRHSATAFAMITLGLGELAWAAALMFPQVFGGETGLTGNRTAGGATWGISLGPAWQMYGLVLAYTAATVLCIAAYTRTGLGRLLNAVRDNAERVSFLGHDPRRIRWAAFVYSSFFAGMAGGLGALLHEIVSTEVLASQRSAAVLVFTVIGGVGTWLGPLLGGVLMVAGQVLLSAWTPAWQLYLGLVFLAIVLGAPGGMAGWLQSLLLQPVPVALRLWTWSAGVLAAVGMGALVEMAYRLRLADTLGSELPYLGFTLDAHALSDWLGAVCLVMLAGWAWLHLQSRIRAVRAGA